MASDRRDARATRPRTPGLLPGPGGFRLGRLSGIEVRVDWSLLLAFVLIATSLGTGVFPRWHPTWPPLVAWATALAAAVLFFASILLHELSHALVARTQGVAVPRITLFLFGGVAHMEAEAPTPRAEFLIAAVGPLTSLALGALGIVAGVGLAGLDRLATSDGDFDALMTGLSPPATLLLWLGPINVTLALFNLTPGFPLDGGRVLRAFLWWATGDLTLATRWATGAGRGFAALLMVWGLFLSLRGSLADGIWLLLIGGFLYTAARASLRDRLLRDALRGVPLARLVRTAFDRVDPGESLGDLADHFLASDQLAFPVEREGVLLGLVSADVLGTVPREAWPGTRVADVQTPLGEVATLPLEASAEDALGALSKGAEVILVLEGRTLVGLVTAREVLRWLTVRPPLRLRERAA